MNKKCPQKCHGKTDSDRNTLLKGVLTRHTQTPFGGFAQVIESLVTKANPMRVLPESRKSLSNAPDAAVTDLQHC